MNIPQSVFDANYGAATAAQSVGITRNTNSNNRNQNQPEAEFWLNVGLPANSVVPGEAEPRFISLPMGLPLDTMKPAKVSGSNELYRQLQTAKNDLWEQLMRASSRLQPGQEMELPLVVRVRRVKQDVPVQTNGSPFGFTLALPVPGLPASAQVVNQTAQTRAPQPQAQEPMFDAQTGELFDAEPADFDW